MIKFTNLSRADEFKKANLGGQTYGYDFASKGDEAVNLRGKFRK